MFSVYKIDPVTDYLSIDQINNNRRQEFIDLIKNRSIYDFKTNVSPNDKIITLSTCYGKKRLVVHGVLTK